MYKTPNLDYADEAEAPPNCFQSAVARSCVLRLKMGSQERLVAAVCVLFFCVSAVSALPVSSGEEMRRNGTAEVCRSELGDKSPTVTHRCTCSGHMPEMGRRGRSADEARIQPIQICAEPSSARAMEDCKWYEGDIRIEFFTKNFTIVDANNYRMKLQLPIQVRDGSLYDTEERPTIFNEAVSAAIDHLNASTPERGSYILVITDFQKNAEDDKVENEELQRRLMEKAIQLRIIQLTFDSDEKTTFMSRDLINSHRVSTVGDYVGRVQVFEAKNVMDHFRPCPPLSQNDKLTQTRTANHLRTQLWIERNIGATLIGGFLLVLAFLSVLLAYNFHKMEKNKVRKCRR